MFGKVGRIASEEVTLSLCNSKCLPILLYGLEAFALNESTLQSLDFSVNRFFMKLFKTSSMAIITECQTMFMFKAPSVILADRAHNLRKKMEYFRALF